MIKQHSGRRTVNSEPILFTFHSNDLLLCAVPYFNLTSLSRFSDWSSPQSFPHRNTVNVNKLNKTNESRHENRDCKEINFLRSLYRGNGISPTDSRGNGTRGIPFVIQDPWPVPSTLRHLSLTTVILPTWFCRWSEAKEQQLKWYVGGGGVSIHGSSFRSLTTVADKPTTLN
jgi:hypothetical protein